MTKEQLDKARRMRVKDRMLDALAWLLVGLAILAGSALLFAPVVLLLLS